MTVQAVLAGGFSNHSKCELMTFVAESQRGHVGVTNVEKSSSQTFTFESDGGKRISAVLFRNPDGTAGGWVASNASIGHDVYIEKGAVVGPSARVLDGKRVPRGTVVAPGATFG